MPNSNLYRTLVPEAPIYRRTDKDTSNTADFIARKGIENFLLEQNVQPGLQQPSLISSYSGSIDHLLFAFPTYSVKNTDLAAAYQSLIEELRIGTKFIVIHHEDDKAIVQGWFTSVGHSTTDIVLIPLPNYINFTDWAEDGYVALQDAADGSHYLMEPWEFPRSADSLIAEAVQEFTQITASQAPLIFQGGNCLIGGNFWLLGKDYFADSVQLTQNSRPPVDVPVGTTPEAFVRQLFSDYVDEKRNLIVLGTRKVIPLSQYYGVSENDSYYLDIAAGGVGTFQPIFHIDMFVSLVGENEDGDFEILVGSPALGDQLLRTESPYALNSTYDDVAKQLEGEGFVVHRNPLVHRPSLGQTLTIAQLQNIGSQPGNEALLEPINQLVAAGATEQDSVTVRDWHHVTWNNCLVENSASKGKHVYLPTFGHGNNSDLAIADQAMEEIWSDLGFTPHMLGDFNEFAKRQGVVHCVKKYIARGD